MTPAETFLTQVGKGAGQLPGLSPAALSGRSPGEKWLFEVEGELKGSAVEVTGQGSWSLLTNPSLWCSLGGQMVSGWKARGTGEARGHVSGQGAFHSCVLLSVRLRWGKVPMSASDAPALAMLEEAASSSSLCSEL